MDNYEYLDCYTGKTENDKLYIVSILYGIVLEYDLKDFSYKVLTQIMLPDSNQMVRVNSIIKIEHFLYMTLRNSWNIFEYNMRNKKLKVYGNNFEYIDGKEIIVKSHLYQDKIWLFPYDASQKIRVFHIKTKKFKDSVSVEEILNRKGNKIPKGTVICYDVFQEEQKCNLAVYNTPYIIEMNLETEKYNIYKVRSNIGIEIMSYVNGQFWLSYIDEDIVERWSPLNGILETYKPKKNYIQKKWKYRYIFQYKEKIFIALTFHEIILIIDKKNQKETILEYSKDIQRVHNPERGIFFGFVRHKDRIIFLPFTMTHFLVLNLETEQLELHSCRFGNDVINKYWKRPKLQGNILFEIDEFELSRYLKFLSGYDPAGNECVNEIGEKVWLQLR